MRPLLLLFWLLLAATAAPAQDLLTKRNGDEFQVKVLEITPTEIKYRRTDNPDGPLVSLLKTEVFLIRYANGTKEVFNAVRATPPLAPKSAVRAAFPNDVPTVDNSVPTDAVFDEPIHLAGPRVGCTVLSSGVVHYAKENGTTLTPFLTQFGWQFESRLFRLPNGVSGLVEFVPLVGGLEQSQFIPSISGLLGIRGAKGFEFGVGPNLTPLGASVVLALGTSVQSGGVNFPINLAVVPSKEGARVSLLLGFNARRR